MTREEAIKELKEDIELYIPLRGTIDDVDRDLPDGRLITALEMAIKALEQEPCEDAISRQAAIDAMYALCNTGETLKENPWRDNPHIDAITDAIENLPSVNPQPKTGHWINHYDEEAKEGWYECDCCHTERAFNTDFCPDCGARMFEPQETETWNGIHAQLTAPKGTFERIFNDADDDNDI